MRRRRTGGGVMAKEGGVKGSNVFKMCDVWATREILLLVCEESGFSSSAKVSPPSPSSSSSFSALETCPSANQGRQNSCGGHNQRVAVL